jgi:threonine aldolase
VGKAEGRVIDLRSDTKTRPSEAMRHAMAVAEVGDDESGEDPTVNRLQDYAADLFGKEAALYFPTGTMSNQVALRTHAHAGDEVFIHSRAHIFLYEMAAAAALSGLQLRGFESTDGTLDTDEMEPYVQTDEDADDAVTRIVALENTHNACGGRVYPLQRARAMRVFCDRHGIALHLDGARLFNAHVATGVPLRDLAAPFDSLNVCLSKGLGAPVGSLLLGTEVFIRRARRFRAQFGGAMRQAGIVAGGGLYALQHNIDRLADDHRRARRLAELLAAVSGLAVDVGLVETNMVLADTAPAGLTADQVTAAAAQAGLLADPNPYGIRFVTHLDVDDEDIETAGAIVGATVARLTR